MSEFKTPVSENLVRWLANGERGISSNSIVQHLTGIPTLRGWQIDAPADPDDLRRCRLLLESVPELVPLIPRMATASPEWAALVPHWDELCRIMDEETPEWRRGRGTASRTYSRMQELLERR